MTASNLITADTPLAFTHLQLPLQLFRGDVYANLSMNAKVAYSFILNRIRLSQANSLAQPGTWANNEGAVYAIYPREDLAKDLCISLNYAISCVKALIKSNLIIEERQGQGKPNRIYLVDNDLLRSVRKEPSNDSSSNEPSDAQPSDLPACETSVRVSYHLIWS